MKRIAVFTLLLLAAATVLAQTTTVSSTGVVDTDSLTWANGTYNISFVGSSPQGYTWNGGNMVGHTLFTGSLDSSGAFSVGIPDSTQIFPTGTQWNFTICPNATSGCFSVLTTVSGSTQDLTSTLNAAAKGPRFAANPSAFGYGTVEISTPPSPGAFFFNTGTTLGYQYNGTSWVATSGGTPFAYPSGTGVVTVSGGTAWGTTLSETGTGSAVLATSPTLVTPALGTPSALVITNATGTCTSCTSNSVTGLTLASGKTLTVNNSLTLAGTDSTTMTFPSSSATIPGVGIANTFSAAQVVSVAAAASTSPLSITGAVVSGGTGTTSFPQLLIQPTGTTASTGWVTSGGTALGINIAAPGRYIDAWNTGSVHEFMVDGSGNVSFNGSITGFANTVGVLNSGFFGLALASSTGLSFSSTANQSGTKDTGIDRSAAGVVESNLGTAAGSGGSFKAASYQAGGTAFTVSGCGTAGSITGGASAGSFTVGTGTTNCTFTVTINGATGLTAAHGWIANADDTTANIHCVNSATVSATTVIFVCTGTVATNDVIKFSAMAY